MIYERRQTIRPETKKTTPTNAVEFVDIDVYLYKETAKAYQNYLKTNSRK